MSGPRRILVLSIAALVVYRRREDLGVALVELLAYVGDKLGYAQDATVSETYLGTVGRRISKRRHRRQVDPAPSDQIAEEAMSEENVERLRTVYEQWAQGNFRAGGELFDDDVVFRTFEAIADEDLVVHGKDGVTDFMRRFLQGWDDLRIEARSFAVNGDKILVESRQSGRGRLSGAEVQMDISHVWTFRGGRATEFRSLMDRKKALKAAGLSG
jgi:ketosteroid isomerase-like protein